MARLKTSRKTVADVDPRDEIGAAIGHLQMADSLVAMAIAKPVDAAALNRSAVAQIKAADANIETAMTALAGPPFLMDDSRLDDPTKGLA